MEHSWNFSNTYTRAKIERKGGFDDNDDNDLKGEVSATFFASVAFFWAQVV